MNSDFLINGMKCLKDRSIQIKLIICYRNYTEKGDRICI